MNHKDAYNRAIKMNKFPKQFNRDNLNLANCYLDLHNKAIDALKHILWIKDIGIDGTDETGKFRNWPESERDAMYKVAKNTLEELNA
jgi:hypothetical protein